MSDTVTTTTAAEASVTLAVALREAYCTLYEPTGAPLRNCTPEITDSYIRLARAVCAHFALASPEQLPAWNPVLLSPARLSSSEPAADGHTPEPWLMRPQGAGQLVYAAGRQIALVHSVNVNPEAGANLRLILGAPGLLTTSRRLASSLHDLRDAVVQRVKDLAPEASIDYLLVDFERALLALDASIAQAGGRV